MATENILEGEFRVAKEELENMNNDPEGAEETLEYDKFTEILASGKYGGELWAESEREKLRAQTEVRLSSKRNNSQRLQQASDRLQKAIDDQKAIEEEFPSSGKWGKYYISIEAINARTAENNTQ